LINKRKGSGEKCGCNNGVQNVTAKFAVTSARGCCHTFTEKAELIDLEQEVFLGAAINITTFCAYVYVVDRI
jgi:hypothetical protein